MDPKRHRVFTGSIGLLFIFAVFTNVLIIHPDIRDIALVGAALLLVIGATVWMIVRYKQRLPW